MMQTTLNVEKQDVVLQNLFKQENKLCTLYKFRLQPLSLAQQLFDQNLRTFKKLVVVSTPRWLCLHLAHVYNLMLMTTWNTHVHSYNKSKISFNHSPYFSNIYVMVARSSQHSPKYIFRVELRRERENAVSIQEITSIGILRGIFRVHDILVR